MACSLFYRNLLHMLLYSSLDHSLKQTHRKVAWCAYCGCWDTMNHAPLIVHDVSNNTAMLKQFDHTNLPWTEFELGSLGLQAGVLPFEPPLLIQQI